MGVVVKGNIDLNKIYNNDVEITLRYDENVIKRDRINYSIPQKVRFGMLPYQALLDYEEEKRTKERFAAKDTRKDTEIPIEITETGENTEPAESKPKKNKTFWEEDEGDRQNVSQEEYEKILAGNGVDISAILGQNDVMKGLFDNIN